MKLITGVPVILFLVWATTSFGQAGSLDPQFGGGDGQVSTYFFHDQPCQAYAVVVHPNGNILISGATRGADNKDHAVLACYQPDGTPDHQFNGNGKMIISIDGISSFSQALAVQEDGKILLVVRVELGSKTLLHLYRFNTDGSPDITFDGDGVVISDFNARYLSGRAIALQPDGKILIGGYIGQDESFDMFYVARYLPDGSLDTQFDEDGITATRVGESYTAIGSLLLQPDGKIIAAGYGVFNNDDAFAAVRFHTDGALDLSFGEQGITHADFEIGDDRANGAVLQADGKIVLGGYAYSNVTEGTDFAAARFNADGLLDNSFHGDGMVTIQVSAFADQARSILLQPDGRIVLGGYAHSNMPGVNSEMSLVRLNANGVPDFTFDGDGVAIYEDNNSSGEVHNLALQPDGKIVGAGFIHLGGFNTIRVARFISGLTVGTHDVAWAISGPTLYPNPASEEIRLEYELTQDEVISVLLYDMQARIVQPLLPAAERHTGHHFEQLSIDPNLLPGQYLVCMKTRNGSMTIMLLIN